MRTSRCKECGGQGKKDDEKCTACGGTGNITDSFARPVHVFATIGAEFLGVIVAEWSVGDKRWVRLEPGYRYIIVERQNPNGTPAGVTRVVQTPWLLHSAERIEIEASIVTDVGEAQFADLARVAEDGRVKARAKELNIELPNAGALA